MKIIASAAALAVALAVTSPANAVDLRFTLTGTYVDGTTLNTSFIIDESPVVDPANAGDGVYFFLTNIAYAGAPSGFAAIQFFNDDPLIAGGGILIVDNDDFSTLFDATDGKQYYENSEFNPHFLVGTYTNLIGLGNSLDSGNFTLTIAPVGGAVPEPASWAMMIGGFALAGAAMRRTRKSVSVRFTA